MNRVILSIKYNVLKVVNSFYVKSLNIIVHSDFLDPISGMTHLRILKKQRSIKGAPYRTLSNIYDGVIKIFSNKAKTLKYIAKTLKIGMKVRLIVNINSVKFEKNFF